MQRQSWLGALLASFGLVACVSAPVPEWPTSAAHSKTTPLSPQVSVAHRSAAVEPASPVKPTDSETGASALVEASLIAIGSGLFDDSLPDPGPISFTEVRFLGGRETPDRSSNKAWGLGVELSTMIDQGFYGDIGYWVLEESKGEENDVGRLSLGLGYAEALGDSTAVFARAGFEWERGRQSSANFLSFVYDDETLFGGDDNEFGVTGDVGLRHRASSHLELVAGLRGETLRKDSVGWFAQVRGFLTPNFALLVGFEDTDEETITFGLAVVF